MQVRDESTKEQFLRMKEQQQEEMGRYGPAAEEPARDFQAWQAIP